MSRAPIPPGSWGTISVYRRGNAWQASVRARGTDGVLRQIRAQGSTKGAARRALAAALNASVNAPASDMDTSTNVEQMLTAWLEWMETTGRVRPQTVSTYRTVCEAQIVPRMGALRIGEVTPARVQEVLIEISPGQRKMARTILSQAFAHARRNGAGIIDPVEATVLPRKPEREPHTLTPEQVARLRGAVRNYGMSRTSGPAPTMILPVAVDIMLGTGMRIGEVCALNWEDVHLGAEPYITVRATMAVVDGKLIRQEQGKTEHATRTLYLPQFVVWALGDLGVRSCGPVLLSRAGTHVAPNNLRRMLRSAVAEAGLDFEVTPHTLRRTLATWIERGATLRDASAQLGHSSEQVTTQHYVARRHEGPHVAGLIQGLVEFSTEGEGRADDQA